MELPFKGRTVFLTTLPILFEGLAIFTALALLIADQYGVGRKSQSYISTFQVALFVTMLCQIALHLGGHYNPAPKARLTQLFFGLSKIYAVVFVLFMALLLVAKGRIDAHVILGGFGLLLAISLGWRLFWAKVTQIRLFRQKVLILGTSSSTCRILQAVGGDAQGSAKSCDLEIVPVDDCQKLVEAAAARNATQLVVCRSMEDRLGAAQLCSLKHRGIVISDEAALMEGVCGWTDPERIDPQAVVFSKSFRRSSRRFCKRAGDILLAALLLLFLAPLMAAMAISLKWRQPGRVLAKDTCLGMGRKPFTRYRFHASSPHPEIHPHIRGIQALPQLWNVIKGDMSLVGPCPIGAAKADDIARVMPLFDERFTVRPGLTGWAQINGDCDVSRPQTVQQMFGYDLFYLKYLTLLLDIVIAARAVQFQALGRQNSDNAS